MKFKLSLFTVVILIFLSCQKQSEIEYYSVHDNAEISVQDGMLVFKSRLSFLKQMAEWNKMDPPIVDKQLASKEFVSYYNDTTLNKSQEIHPDILFQKVLNNKGAIKINDSIYVLTETEEILIKDATQQDYEAVLSGNLSSDKIEIHLSENRIQNLEITPYGPVPGSWYGESQHYTPVDDNGRSERMRITLYAASSGVYPASGLKVRGEAYRRCGLWCVDWRADEIYQLTVAPNSFYQLNGHSQVSMPAGTVWDHEETTLISVQGTDISGAHFGFSNLNVRLSMKKTAANPTREIGFTIANGNLQPIYKNW